MTATATTPRRSAPSARTLSGVLVSAGALAAVVWWASRQEAPQVPSRAGDLALLGFAVLLYGCATVIRGWRWHVILRLDGIEHRRRDALGLVCVGYMGNTVLPARGGEVLRILLLSRRTRARKREVLGSIVAERVLDAVVLVSLFAFLTYVGVAGTPVGVAPAFAATAALAMLAAGLGLYLRLRRAGRFDGFAQRVRPIVRASRPMLGRTGALLALATGLVWLMEAVIFALVARSLGIHLDLVDALFVNVLASFFALIPAAPGYVGTFDAAVLFALKALGVAGGTAVTFALLVRFVLFVPITIAGLVLLLAAYGGLASLREARTEERPDHADADVRGAPTRRPSPPRRGTGAGWPAAVAAVAGLALAAAIPYVLGFSQHVVMPDEQGYMKQAVHLATTGLPSLPGDMWFNSYAQLAPLLLALPYAVLPTPVAFDAAHVLQAVALASTAVPAFLLARTVTGSRPAGLVAAALAVAVPWLGMSATLMTEPLAYAATAWTALALTRAIAAPSPRRDAAALAALLAVALVRTQLIVLWPAFLLAIVAFEAVRTRSPRRAIARAVRGHALVWGLALVALCAYAALGASRALGAYATAAGGDLLPAGMASTARELVATVAMGTAALPVALALGWVLGVLGRRRERPEAQAFAVLLAVTSLAVVLTTASFLQRSGAEMNDRYVMHLVPLVAVGAAALLFDARVRPLAIVTGGALTAALVGTAGLESGGPTLVSPAQTFQPVLEGRGGQLGALVGVELGAAELLAAIALTGAAAVAGARARLRALPVGAAVGAALVAACAIETGYVLRQLHGTQQGASRAFLDMRDWVDRTVPGDERIGAVVGPVFPDRAASHDAWYDLLFWSKRTDRVFRLPGSEDVYGQPFWRDVAVDAGTGRLRGMDERPLLAVAAAERRFALRGQEVVAAQNGFAVVRADRPYRLAWQMVATDDQARITLGRTGELRVYGAVPGERSRLRMTLAPGPYAARGYRVRVRSAGRAVRADVPKDGAATVTVPLRAPEDGPARITIGALAALPGPDPDNAVGVQLVDARPLGRGS